jgi:chromate transport protein ChrA
VVCARGRSRGGLGVQALRRHLVELARLAVLHGRGALTDEEFAAEKAVYMSSPGPLNQNAALIIGILPRTMERSGVP